MTRWSLFLQTLSLLHHFLGLYSCKLSPDEGPTLTMRLKTPSRYRNFTLELQPEVKPVETES